MSIYKKYRRIGISEARPVTEADIEGGMNLVSISPPDREAGSPKIGDMIFRNPKNYADQWLVTKKYFEENFELLRETEANPMNADKIITAIESDWKRRVRDELEELEEKIKKLAHFITVAEFKSLPENTRELLKMQLDTMNAYRRILLVRLK